MLLLIAGIVGLLALRISEPKPLRELQYLGFDLMQGIAPEDAAPSDFAVVTIGEESLERIGPWPWPRDELAGIVDELSGLGAAAVVLTLLLDAPDRFSAQALLGAVAGDLSPDEVEGLSARLSALPQPDVALERALSRMPTALATAVRGGGRSRDGPSKPFSIPSEAVLSPEVPRFDAVTQPTPQLRAVARAEGAVNLLPEEDMVLRRAALFYLVDGVVHPSLAVAGFVAAGRPVRLTQAPSLGTAIMVGEAARPTNAAGVAWLDFSRRGKIPVLEVGRLGADAAPLIAGRIVVLGLDVPGIGRPLRLADGSLASEPELIAILGDALDVGSVLSRPVALQAFETAALAIGLAIVWIVWLSTAPGIASLVTLSLGICWVVTVVVARAQMGLVLDLATPPMLWVLFAAVSAGLRTVKLWQIRRDLVDELRVRTKAAEAANEAKTRFLHEMHHDIRTPLNAVLGLSGLLKGRGRTRLSPEQVADYATTIQEAGAHVLRLSEQALQAAEYATEHAPTNRRDVDLGEILTRAAQIMLGNRNRTAALDLRIDPSPHVVHADPTQLLEAVLNLLDNAFKHAVGTETVVLASHPLGNGKIAIDILDEGPGIDEAFLKEIGTPFLAGRAEHDGVRGAGLGLFIVQRFAKAHLGQLQLGMRADGGFRARLELDLVDVQPSEEVQPSG